MDDMEYIDQFFSSTDANADSKGFDQRILSDPAFAEQVAFYLMARQALQQKENAEVKQRFRQMYEPGKYSTAAPVRRMPKFFRYAAAALVVGVIGITYVMTRPGDSLREMADEYIQKNLSSLNTTMSSAKDSLEIAIQLYNGGKVQEALPIFEGLAASKGPDTAEPRRYAGQAALQIGKYDLALKYFEELANDASLYINPGKFYMALTLSMRDKEGDQARATALLKEVVDKDLSGKEQALKMLNKE